MQWQYSSRAARTLILFDGTTEVRRVHDQLGSESADVTWATRHKGQARRVGRMRASSTSFTSRSQSESAPAERNSACGPLKATVSISSLSSSSEPRAATASGL